jgi:hypothetical protein
VQGFFAKADFEQFDCAQLGRGELAPRL